MANRNNVLYGRIAVELQLLSDEVLKPLLRDHLNAPDHAFERALVRESLLTELESARVREELVRLLEQHRGDADAALEAMADHAGAGKDAADSYLMPTQPGAPVARSELSKTLESGAADDQNRYINAEEYARGGMGRILVVHDTRMNRPVALKELIPHTDAGGTTLASGEGEGESLHLVQRFLREARITGSLEHPSIVPVYELGRRADGSHYYTMKLVRGRTLHQAIEHARGLSDRLKLLPHVIDLCQAIAYAHDKGIIHRDIKPSNVMVGSFGETVVIDWGLARVLHRDDPYAGDLQAYTAEQMMANQKDACHTTAGIPVGTPHYMSPEQAEGRMDDVGPRSDVYSLGVVLYEVLAGRTPFTGTNSRVVLQKVRTLKPPSVRTHEAAVPPALAAICARAMARPPEQRHASAGELAEELIRFTTGALVQGYEYTLGELLRHYYRRHTALCNSALAAMVVTLLIATTAYAYILEANHREREQRIAAEAARNDAESSAYRASIQLAANYAAGRHFQQAAALLQEQPAARRNWEWGLLFEQCNQDYATAVDHATPVYNLYRVPGGRLVSVGFGDKATVRSCPDLAPRYEIDLAGLPNAGAAVSPDGTWLAVMRMDGLVQLHDLGRYQMAHELRVQGAAFTSAVFSGDSALLAAGAGDGSLYVWNVSTGERVWHIRGHDVACRVIGMNQDGSLAVTSDHNGRTIVWDTRSGTVRREHFGHDPSFSGDYRIFALRNGGAMQVYDLETGALRFESETLSESAGPPLIDPTGKVLATLARDGEVRVWNVDSGRTHAVIPDDTVSSILSFSEDGAIIALAVRPHAVQLRRTSDGGLLQTLEGHSQPVADGEFGDDGRTLYTCAGDREVKSWQIRDTESTSGPPTRYGTRSVAVSEADALIAAGSAEGVVHFVDTRTRMPRLALASFERLSLLNTAFNLNGGRAVVTPGARTAFVIQLSDAAILSRWDTHEDPITLAGISPDGFAAATAGDGPAVPVWRCDTGAELLRFEGHRDRVQALVFGPERDRIATGDRGGRLLLWNWRTAEVVRELRAEGSPVRGIACSADGRHIAAVFESGPAAVYTVDSEEPPRYLSSPDSVITSLVYSNDGDRLVGLAQERELRIWDAASGQPLLSPARWETRMFGLALDDTHHQAVLAGRGDTLEVIVATPQDLAGGEGVSPASLEAYKRSRTRFTGQIALGGSTIIGLTPPSVALEAAGRLEAAPSTPLPGGYVEPMHNPLARLGIRSGDRVAAVNGQTCADTAFLRERIGAFAGASSDARMLILLVRGGDEMQIEHRWVAEVVRKRSIRFDRAGALTALRDSLGYFRTFEGQFLEYSQRRANDRGADLREADALHGFWVPPTSSRKDEEGLAKLGLANGDRITSVNGTTVTRYRDLISWTERAIKALESGETGQTHLRVERDRYSSMDLTWTVE